MKTKLLTILTIILSVFALSAKEVKVLTIGNSFAESVFVFLPRIADSVPDCKLVLEGANHGGYSLDAHLKLIQEEDADESVKNYQKKKKSLKEILSSQDWNIVTIQQVSTKSFLPETFFPYALDLKNYILKYAPNAELVLQQTWSYRADDARISEGGTWGFDQNEMFKKIEAAYTEAAKKLNARIIPSGIAVQLAREKQSVKFQNYKPEILKTLNPPDFPSQAGALVGEMKWKKNKQGKMYIEKDTIHLNDRGRYLQACVWFAFLFDEPTSKITFVPNTIADDDAAFLRQIAQKAIDSIKQKK